jgi:hypothetical protein
LDGRKEKADERADDGDHHEQFDESEAAAASVHTLSAYNGIRCGWCGLPPHSISPINSGLFARRQRRRPIQKFIGRLFGEQRSNTASSPKNVSKRQRGGVPSSDQPEGS